jgi:hypothetical protein
MFTTPPAGTPVEPTNGVRYYYRRQIYPATPSTGADFQPGREVQWRFQASGQHAFVPQESRLVARVRVEKSNDNGASWDQDVESSVRYACDPLTRLVDQARLSINGTTVDNVPTDVQDISTIQLRLEGTKAGAAAAGSAGLLSFDQRMHHPNLAGTGQGNPTFSYMADGTPEAAMAVAQAADTNSYQEVELQNEKQRILLDASSAGLDVTRGGGAIGGAANQNARLHEISTPLGQMFTFFRQNKAFLRNMEFDVRMVVNSEKDHDALFTQAIPAQPRNQGVLFTAEQGMAATLGYDSVAMAGYALGFEALGDDDRTFVQLNPAIAPAAASINGAGNIRYRVYVSEFYIDGMFAVPRVPLEPPLSMQIPYQSITQYSRALTANQAFTETFSGIPPSVTAIVVAMRSEAHRIDQNRELYLAGGSSSTHSFKTFQMQMGSLSLPQPSYDLDLPNRRAGRAFADYISFIGGDHKDGTGAMGYTEWCESPLLCFRILQNPGEYSSTLTLRFTTQNAVAPGTTLTVFCLHSKVFEAEWNQGESMPNKVLVDEILT